MHDTGARFLYISKSVLMSFVRDVLLRISVLYTPKKLHYIICQFKYVGYRSSSWTQNVLKCVIYQPPLPSLRRELNFVF